jgi:hypothetical protein
MNDGVMEVLSQKLSYISLSFYLNKIIYNINSNVILFDAKLG